MKRTLLVIVSLLMAVGMNAGVVTNHSSVGSAMTYANFKALSGTGAHFGLMAVSENSATYGKWFGFVSANSRVDSLTTAQLFTLTSNTTTSGYFNFQRYSDKLYLSAAGAFGETAMGVNLVNRAGGDYASEYATNMQVSIDNASGGHYNANSYAFAAGTGGWSAYVAYGPFYVATIECVDNNGETMQAAKEQIVTSGYTPSYGGYSLTTDPTSGSGITKDGTYRFVFTQTADPANVTYNYTYGGKVVYTETIGAYVGDAYPDPTYTAPAFMTYTKPEGNIGSTSETKEIAVTPNNYPFEFAASYGAITQWYNMKLRPDATNYLQYVAGQDYIPLGQTSVVGNSFAWAFVGNPFDGFRVVNYVAGNGYILSSGDPSTDSTSGGSTYPKMYEEANLPAGQNTVWFVGTPANSAGQFQLKQDGTGYFINARSPAVAYWTGGHDIGSDFVVAATEIVNTIEYHVTCATDGGGVTYDGNNYTNDQTITVNGEITKNDVPAIEKAGYLAYVTISNTDITVVYVKDWTPSLPEGYVIRPAAAKAATVTSVTTKEDNDHWYLLVNHRNGNTTYFDEGMETPIADQGAGTIIRRASADYNPAYFELKDVADNTQYIVRFIATEKDSVYNIQFANGRFIAPNATTISNGTGLTSSNFPADFYFYNIDSTDGHFGWNIAAGANDSIAAANRVDNNGAGGTVVFWGTGVQTTTGGNSDWYVYEVALTERPAEINYTVNVTGTSKEGAGILFNGTTYTNGQTFTGASDVTPTAVNFTGFNATVTIDGATITVAYSLNWDAFTELTDSTNLSNTKIYVVRPYENDRGTWVYDSADTFMNSTVCASVEVDPTNVNEQFAFLTSNDGNVYLYSMGAQKFVNYTSGSTIYGTTPNNAVRFRASTGSFTTYPFVVSYVDGDSFHDIGISNYYTNVGGIITSWNSTEDGGNCLKIYEVGTADLSAVVDIINEYEHPSAITYDVVVRGIPENTAAGVVYEDVTYSNGQQVAIPGETALTIADVVVAEVANYKSIVRDVAVDGPKGTITVQYYYDLSAHTHLTTMEEIQPKTGYIFNNAAGAGVMRAKSDSTLTFANLTTIDSRGMGNVEYFSAYDPTSKSDVWQILTDGENNRYIYNPAKRQFLSFSDGAYRLSDELTPMLLSVFTTQQETGEVDSEGNAITEAVSAGVFNINHGDITNHFACAATYNTSSPVRWWNADDTNSQWQVMPSTFTNLTLYRDYTVKVEGLEEGFDSSEVGLFVPAEDDTYYNNDSFTETILMQTTDYTAAGYVPTDLSAEGYESTVNFHGGIITITYNNNAHLDDLRTALATAEKYIVGSGVGQYTDAGNVFTDARAAVKAYADAEKVLLINQADVDAAVQAMNDAIPGLVLNMPVTGAYYRIKGSDSGHYVTAPAGSQTLNSTSSAAAASNIFFLDENSKFVSYNNPLYLTGGVNDFNAVNLADVDASNTLTFSFEASSNRIASYVIGLGDGMHLYDWTSYSTDNVLATKDSTHGRNQWLIEPVDTLPLTLTKVDTLFCTTLYLPVDVEIVGATPYAASFGDGTVTLSAIEDGIVPANTGVVLKGTSATAKAAIISSDATVNSDLGGTIVTTGNKAANPYVFAYRNGYLGFFQFVGTTFVGNRAYYDAITANVNGFVIDWDGATTGIEGITSNTAVGNIYDLSGRLVKNPQRGIYIQNGKKFMHK